MAHSFAIRALVSLTALTTVHAYFLVGPRNFLTIERIDPIVNIGTVATHVHSVLGGSNFRVNTNTSFLRQSECTSMPIAEDKSAYWFPVYALFPMEERLFHFRERWFCHVYVKCRFIRHHRFDILLDYLYDGKPGVTTAFPDDFRMISGDPLLRTYDPNSKAQKAITFLCLDFNGVTTKHDSLPNKSCPSGIRSQVNFPMCWDGKNTDSPDHKSHVAFPSGGPDSGDCTDPNYPVRMPRIFNEIYWATNEFEAYRNEAMKPDQPFVFSHGDRTGYGYHGDFINGWDEGVLQRVVDKCYCNDFGDASCCAQQGLFTLNTEGHCRITRSINEITTGTLPKLPGNNPVQEEGNRASMFTDNSHPGFLSPVYVYTGDQPDKVGTPVAGGSGPGNVPTYVAEPSSPVSTAASASAASSEAAATTIASSEGSTQTQGSAGSTSAASGPASTPASGPYGGVGTSTTSSEDSAQTQGSAESSSAADPASGPYGGVGTSTTSSEDSAQTQGSAESTSAADPASSPTSGQGTSTASSEESAQGQSSAESTSAADPVSSPTSGQGTSTASSEESAQTQASSEAPPPPASGPYGSGDDSTSGGHVYGSTGSSNGASNGSNGTSGSHASGTSSSSTCHRRTTGKRRRSLRKARHHHDSRKRFTDNLF
uniref:DUF1996 domain-containing protein n=1 Tax=Moniliophthora roreri TaxID=221103 RepID=A0A0W0F7N3_MONRR